MKKCKNAFGHSDTADLVKDFSPLFQLQRKYFSLDIEDIQHKDKNFLQYCSKLVCTSFVDLKRFSTTRLKRMGNRIPSIFSHLTDVDELLVSYVTNKYSSKPLLVRECDNRTCLKEFFEQNQMRLYYPCTDHRVFSHCQKHWIAVYNAEKHKVSSYKISGCTYSKKLWL